MKGLNQSELAGIIGVSLGSIGNWESGQNKPPPKQLRKIADALGVTIPYLLGEDEGDTPFQVRNIEHSFIREASNAHDADPPRRIQMVPVISWASAGSGNNYSDNEAQLAERVQSEVADKNAYALIVEGDSMEPLFRMGDRIIVSPNTEAQNGDVVVARLKERGEVYFKIFHRDGPMGQTVRLTSYNPAYPETIFKITDFRIIAPVQEMVRKMRR